MTWILAGYFVTLAIAIGGLWACCLLRQYRQRLGHPRKPHVTPRVAPPLP